MRWFPPKPSQETVAPTFSSFREIRGWPPGPPVDPRLALCGLSRIFVLYLCVRTHTHSVLLLLLDARRSQLANERASMADLRNAVSALDRQG